MNQPRVPFLPNTTGYDILKANGSYVNCQRTLAEQNVCIDGDTLTIKYRLATKGGFKSNTTVIEDILNSQNDLNGILDSISMDQKKAFVDVKTVFLNELYTYLPDTDAFDGASLDVLVEPFWLNWKHDVSFQTGGVYRVISFKDDAFTKMKDAYDKVIITNYQKDLKTYAGE